MLLLRLAAALAILGQLSAAIGPEPPARPLHNSYTPPHRRMDNLNANETPSPAILVHTCACDPQPIPPDTSNMRQETVERRMAPLTSDDELIDPSLAISHCGVVHNEHGPPRKRMAPRPSDVGDTPAFGAPSASLHTCPCVHSTSASPCSNPGHQTAASSVVTVKRTTVQYVTIGPSPTPPPQLSYVTIRSTTVQYITVHPTPAPVAVSTIVQINHQVIALQPDFPAPAKPVAPEIVLIVEEGIEIKRGQNDSSSRDMAAKIETWALMLPPLTPQSRITKFTAAWDDKDSHVGRKILDCRVELKGEEPQSKVHIFPLQRSNLSPNTLGNVTMRCETRRPALTTITTESYTYSTRVKTNTFQGQANTITETLGHAITTTRTETVSPPPT